MKTYDIAILGGGPGGYVTAIYAAGHGMRTCLIEKNHLGGTCLNYGCIPTKIFTHAAKTLSDIKKGEAFGIGSEKIKFEISSLVTRKNETIGKLRRGISSLLRSRNVDTVIGRGRLVDKDTISVIDSQSNGGAQQLKAKNIIIATGSSPAELPNVQIDGQTVLSAENALDLLTIPSRLVVVGGGAIGCEMANAFNAFGAKVTIVEAKKNLLPQFDHDISRCLETVFTKRGIRIITGHTIKGRIEKKPDSVSVKLTDGQEILCDKVLLSVGRIPAIDDIGLKDLGIEYSHSGISVDNMLRTNVSNIYAIGDCIGGRMLAHTAMNEGVVACNNICGKKESADYEAVPECVFTDSDIASVGTNEKNARSNNMNFKVAKFYFRGLGKACAVGKTDGFIKIITDKKSSTIIGGGLIGEGATELVAEITLAIRKGLTAQDVAGTIHAHPTMSEAVMEACYGVLDRPIHGA